MAKAFFRQNQTTLVWEYGSFKADGVTPDVEYTVPSGLYRCRWETINNVLLITIANANNLGELAPIRSLPLSELASDLIGTPYADRASFEVATKDFFFGTSSSSVAAAAGFNAYEITVVLDQTDYALPLEADVTKDWIVSADGVSFSPSTDYTKSLVDGVPTISFNTAPTVGNVPVVWYQKSSQTLELLILRTIQNPGNAFPIDVSTTDFVPTENTPFLIKNDGEDTVTLEVKYADGTDWISTKFKVGWNEDLVKAVKTNVTVMDLKGGVK